MAKGREDREQSGSRCDRLPRHSQKLSCGTGTDTSPKNFFLMPRRQIVAVCAISLLFFCVGRMDAVGQPGVFPSDPDRKERADGKIGHGRRRQIIGRLNVVNSLVPPSFAEKKAYPVHVSPHEADVKRLPSVQLFAPGTVQDITPGDAAAEVVLWADRERPFKNSKDKRYWLKNSRSTFETPEGTRDVLYCHGVWRTGQLFLCVSEILGKLNMKDYFAKAKAVRGVSNCGGTLVVVSDFLKKTVGNPHHVLYLNCILRTSDDLCNKIETKGLEIQNLGLVHFTQMRMFALRTVDIVMKEPDNHRAADYTDCMKMSLALHTGSSMRSNGSDPVAVRCEGTEECKYDWNAVEGFKNAIFKGGWRNVPPSEIPFDTYPETGERLQVNGPEEKPWPRIYCWTGVGEGAKKILWEVTKFIVFYSRALGFTVLKRSVLPPPAGAESK